MTIDKDFLDGLFRQAAANPRLRLNHDLRTSPEDNSQRMLNALLPGTLVPVHRHPLSSENVLLLCGRLDEVLYNDAGEEVERIHLAPSAGRFGCDIPRGAWHTVEVLEPSVIYEAKDGRYGEDGSETLEAFKIRQMQAENLDMKEICSNHFDNLKKDIEYLIGMERHSGSMEVISPLYVSRMLNVPLQAVESCMKEMGL